MRKALAMGAQRGVLVTDPALEGADMAATIRVLAAAAAARRSSTCCSPASTPRTAGPARWRRGSRRGSGCRCCPTAAAIEPDPAAGTVRVRRLSAKGYDVIEAPMPAVISCTQALGAPRYPSLKGIMAARSREIAQALGRRPRRGPDGPRRGAWATRVLAAEPPPARAAGRVVPAPADEAAREVADFLAARRLI